MNKRAIRYIKPEKLKPNVAAANLTTNDRQSESAEFGKKQPEKNASFSKQSSRVTENSNDTSSERNSSEHEELHRTNSTLQPSFLKKISSQTLYSITTGFRKTSSLTHRSSLATESIQGRQRMSTIDPSTIKRLKFIKVDSLKEDDQIELAVLILQKGFEDRTATDIDFLVKCTHNVAFFKKYDEDTHRKCMAKVYHVHLKKDDDCIKYGEIGETFWITLKGKVGIIIPREKEIVGKDGKITKEKVPVKVAFQEAGYAFGELSLLERKPRQATITCEEDSDFAVLDKEHFQQILRDKEEKRLFNEVNFLKTLKIFNSWAYNSLRSLFMYSNLKEAIRNQIIFNYNDPSEYMYIIKTGEFKVMSKLYYDDDNEHDYDPTVKRYLKRKAPAREIELSILGSGEIFGVEDIISDKNRTTSVICISQTGWYIEIKKKEVKSLILADHTANTWLKGYLESRAKINAKRMNEIASNTRSVQNLLMRTTFSNSPMRDSPWVIQSSRISDPSVSKESIPGHFRIIDDYSFQQSSERRKESNNITLSNETLRKTQSRLKEIKSYKSINLDEPDNDRNYLSQLRSLKSKILPSPTSTLSPIKKSVPIKLNIGERVEKQRGRKTSKSQLILSKSRSTKTKETLSSDRLSEFPQKLSIHTKLDSNKISSPTDSLSKERLSPLASIRLPEDKRRPSWLKLQQISSLNRSDEFSGEIFPFLNGKSNTQETGNSQRDYDIQVPDSLEVDSQKIASNNVDFETRSAIQDKLNLNLSPLLKIEQQGSYKKQQMLYNETIISNSTKESKNLTDKPILPLRIRVKKAMNEILEPKSAQLPSVNQLLSLKRSTETNKDILSHTDRKINSQLEAYYNETSTKHQAEVNSSSDESASFRLINSLKRFNDTFLNIKSEKVDLISPDKTNTKKTIKKSSIVPYSQSIDGKKSNRFQTGTTQEYPKLEIRSAKKFSTSRNFD